MKSKNGKEEMMMIQRKFENLDILAIGTELEIVGVIYGSPREDIIILLPDEAIVEPIQILTPTLEQWQQIIRQSDLKETEGMIKDKKVILRKSTRQIEQRVMWEVFRRDNFTCRYCNADKVPMTVDHVVLWEEMGPSIPMNLITSCKKCNNARGNKQYIDWLQNSYYLSRVPKLPAIIIAENSRVVADIPYIKEHHLRTVKRSR